MRRWRKRPPPSMEATNYSIHFHVWTQADLLELVLLLPRAARIV